MVSGPGYCTHVVVLDFRLTHFEMIFIRLLHLVAHSTDFGLSEGQMKEQATYVSHKLYISYHPTTEANDRFTTDISEIMCN